LYFVLGGVLNPIDGQTVEMLRIKELEALLSKSEIISEIILAFSPNIHGETTILFLTKLLNNLNKKTSRLATGLPMGAELEYADEVTLMNAIKGRTKI
ncbi:MAG: toprim domain-containing protein, partial [Patescibacteria group bacterium]